MIKVNLKKTILMLSAASVIIFTALNPGSAATKRFVIGSGTMGGSVHPILGTFADIWNRNIEDVNFSVTTGGAVSNVRDTDAGILDGAFTFSSNLYDALHGRQPFKKEYEHLKGLVTIARTYYQIAVKKESDIRKIEDLIGKRISPGSVGTGGENFTRLVFKEYGFSYEDIKQAGGKLSFSGSGESVMLIKDGHLDSHASLSFIPTGFFMDLASTYPIRLLPIKEEVRETIVKKFPAYSKTTIPANVYRGQENEVETLAVDLIVFVREDMSEELVYKMLETLFSNIERVWQLSKVGEQVMLKTAMNGLKNLPLHSGARRFYKEKGLL